jgi:C-methyltransferase C-terminal domain
MDGLQIFATKVNYWRHEFRKLIAEIRLSDSSIAGIGAPSRASTLISFGGLEHSDLISIGEISNSHKIGRDMPGTKIPIIDEKQLFEIDPPDYLLMLSWHIGDELIEKIKARGYKGKFIIPLPKAKIIE